MNAAVAHAAAALNESDVDLVLHELGRFGETQLQPAFQQPENPVSAATLQRLTEELSALGLLSLNGGSGLGLWEACDSRAGLRLSLQALCELGRYSAGLGYHCHRLALSARLCRGLGLVPGDDGSRVAFLSQGHYGLGGDVLPDWLSGGAAAAPADVGDWLGGTRPRYFQAVGHWRQLLLAVCHEGAVQWSLLPRNRLQVMPQEPATGFDELQCFSLLSAPAAPQTSLSPGESRAWLSEVLRLDALGLLAIACGSLQHAWNLARQHAHHRRQGGCPIIEHPAVRLMLAEVDEARQSTVDWLSGAADRPQELSLNDVFAARARLHPQLCRGADQALQVHGGYGYMRDCGLEKIWREQHCLRRLSGTPLELRMFISRSLCEAQPA